MISDENGFKHGIADLTHLPRPGGPGIPLPFSAGLRVEHMHGFRRSGVPNSSLAVCSSKPPDKPQPRPPPASDNVAHTVISHERRAQSTAQDLVLRIVLKRYQVRRVGTRRRSRHTRRISF